MAINGPATQLIATNSTSSAIDDGFSFALMTLDEELALALEDVAVGVETRVARFTVAEGVMEGEREAGSHWESHVERRRPKMSSNLREHIAQ